MTKNSVGYVTFYAKQGSKTLWSKKASTGTAQFALAKQLDCTFVKSTNTGSIYKVKNKAGLFYYYDNGNLVALNIFTGKVKWRCKSLLGLAPSAASDSKGNLYVVKTCCPGNNSSDALLYKINKKGKIVKKMNWSDGGKYTGGATYGAGVSEVKNGRVVMGVEVAGQSEVFKTLYIDTDTMKIVSVV